jgi:hypothetical protein
MDCASFLVEMTDHRIGIIGEFLQQRVNAIDRLPLPS